MRDLLEKKAFVLVGIIVCFLLYPVDPGYGDGFKGGKHDIRKAYEHSFKGGNHGDETTGEVAAWMFGVANFPVAVSLILKILAKFLPSESDFRDSLSKFNRQQKKLLMKLHYWVNPFALGAALIHFSLSTCRSTTFPEWGLGILLVAVLLGLMMKLKLSPASMRQRVFRLHTSPVLLLAAITILLIGHGIVD